MINYQELMEIQAANQTEDTNREDVCENQLTRYFEDGLRDATKYGKTSFDFKLTEVRSFLLVTCDDHIKLSDVFYYVQAVSDQMADEADEQGIDLLLRKVTPNDYFLVWGKK